VPFGISKYQIPSPNGSAWSGDPSRIMDLVLWIDFTDANGSVMMQSVDGSNPVNTDGQYIGILKNKAPGTIMEFGIPIPGTTPRKLGQWIRARKDDPGNEDEWKPVYKTGGVNGFSYAEFPSTGNVILAGGFYSNFDSGEDATSWGCQTTTYFSDLKMDNHNMTTFIVLQPGAADTSNMHPFSMGGQYDIGTNNYKTHFDIIRNPGEAWGALWTDSGPTGAEALLDSSAMADTNLRCISVVHDNTAHLVIDGTTEDTEALNGPAKFEMQQTTAPTLTADPPGYVNIGGATSQGVLQASSFGETHWHGKIYEVLHFAKVLNGSETAVVEGYFASKYGITFS
jgi:hypothetical protein